MARIRREIENLWRQEEMYWCLRSRIKWLKWGDRNSRFFHAATVQRRQRNRITMLRTSDNVWCRDQNTLKRHTRDFFQNLYSSVGDRSFLPVIANHPRVISEEMNVGLVKPIDMEEVTIAVHQLGSTKAPGPDGLNGLFFQTHWEEIKDDVFKEVQCFFNSGNMKTELNRTFITLIPKIPNPEELSQYRPISLCNFAYKIISKVMANRLKPLLKDIISPEQSAFVEGRQIQDNIMIVQEVIHQLRVRKRKEKFQAILKLDMKKAYDRVEWDFLEAWMKQMGFCAQWVTLVMACIKTVSYSIKFNGDQLPFFQPKRGIRQGDPLSPYLFIILMNVLSYLLNTAVQNEGIRGIRLNRSCPTLSHLLFADDAILFLDGRISECQNVASILNQYCMASGQEVNLNKSGIFFSRDCPDSLKRNMALELRVPVIEKTGKYLGIPSDWGQTKKDMFAWLLAKVNLKLEGWKENFISKAGKEVLIKSVIQALPQYAMSIFKIPLSVCRAIESRIASFWWKQNESKAGIHWRNWSTLKSRKDTGGMGFRDLISFNKSMLGKQAWRLVNAPTSLWSQIFKGLYFPNGHFWSAQKGARSSWGWQSMLVGREVIAGKVKWAVGDGKKILIREDRWLDMGIIGGPANQTDPRWVEELIDHQNRKWKENSIWHQFDREVAEQILAIPLKRLSEDDKLVWDGHKSGKFTVKSAYNLLHPVSTTSLENTASTSSQIPTNFWTKLWQLNIPMKIRIFLWQACQNALPTRDNLFKRKVLPDPLCSICRKFPESVEHTLLLCSWTKTIWAENEVHLRGNKRINRLDNWILENVIAQESLLIYENIAHVFWQIWRMRNAAIFQFRKLDPRAVSLLAKTEQQTYERWNPRPKEERRKKQNGQTTWSPPEQGTLRINIDCSKSENSPCAAVAGAVRDFKGVLIHGFTDSIFAGSVAAGETLALVLCLRFLEERSELEVFRSVKIDIQSNSLDLVNFHARVVDCPWNLQAWMEECWAKMAQWPNISLSWCPREENRLADWLAKAQLNQCLPQNWLCFPPKQMMDVLVCDVNRLCFS